MKSLITGVSLAMTLAGTAWAAETNTGACVDQALNPASAPRQIYPGDTKEVLFRTPAGETAARLILNSRQDADWVVVDVQLENLSDCEVSTFQPVKVHPIRNGLPLGWHSLPQGMQANPKLAGKGHVQYRKEYSKDYAGGFNLAFGSWQMLSSPKHDATENATPPSAADDLFSNVLGQGNIGSVGENPELEEHLSNYKARSEMFHQTVGAMRQVQTLQLQQKTQKQASSQKKCPPGYGLNWEGTCIKCNGPTTVLVCN